MRKNYKNKGGFTLIELLVVIAIIAILAVVVVLTLNPAELLRQARDSNRISDFATLKSALGLYAEDVNTTTPMYANVVTTTVNLFGTSGATSTASTSYTGTAANTFGFATSTTNVYVALVSSSNRTVGGSGWIPVNFNAISSGAPIGSLPVDPTNVAPNIYLYGASSTSYKLATKMESAKYGLNGPNDVVSTDGGNNSSTYEQGSNLQL